MEYEAITTAAEMLIVIGLGVGVLILGYGLIGLAYVILIASFINVLFSLYITIKVFAKPSFRIDLKSWKSTVKEALPFGLTAVFVTVYFQIDTVMLSIMKGDAVVGWYNAAYKLVLALMFIPTTFVGSMFPIISRFYMSSQNSLKVAYGKTFKYLTMIGLPLAIGATILADKIVLIVYGKGFGNSTIALQILIWAMVLMFLTYLFGTVLESINRQREVTKIAGINTLVNICLNLLLIPRFSYIGASVATVATEAVGFILLFYYISKHLHAAPLLKLTLKPLMASLPMGLFIFYFKGINTVVLIAVAVLLYFGMIHWLRGVSEEDIGLFKQVFKKEAATLYKQ
jgi:O-antigen/teichoic acid export membrane protein